MAILRERIPLPGKLGKIFDIRLGLPRERDIDYAKRYRDQKPNENTRINKFRSFVSSAEGLARPNRFIAIVNLPSPLQSNSGTDYESEAYGVGGEFAQYQTQQSMTGTLNDVIKDRLFFFCDTAALPGRNSTDEDKGMLYGPERKVARGLGFEDITLTFYMGQQMVEKMLFESWQNLAINPNTFNANYYNEYVGSIELYPLVHLTNPNFEPWEVDGGKQELTPMQRLKNVNKWAKDGKLPPKKAVKEKKGESRAMAIATVGAYYNQLVEAFPTNILAREAVGFVATIGYMFVMPLLLAKTKLKHIYEHYGPIRYATMMLFGLTMFALPIKMYLRWMFNLKYIVAIPEWFFNI